MKWLAILVILLIAPSALATAVTVDIYGTNVSNAQSNITQTGNNSYQVVQWAIGDTTKSLKADINGNASDDITFTINNLTAQRVVEVKVNGSSYNSYQANSTGAISFTRTQTVRNQTYSFIPAVNAGGYNFTWVQFWTYPSLFGLNFTQYFLPYSGATKDLDMNGKNITNVSTMNVTTTNVTVLNATTIKGNGTGITNFNASNGTGVLPNASIPLSAANLTATTNIFTGTNIKITDGSAGTPPYSFISATNSGLGSFAANSAGIAAGGSERIRATLTGATIFGDLLVDNVLNAAILQGNGSGISSLNASNITIGTLNRSVLLRTITNVTANYTIGASNSSGTMFTCYADSGTLNLTLPVGVVGTEFTIKKKDNTNNICEIYSGQNIDGALRANISVRYNSIDLIYTDEWSII